MDSLDTSVELLAASTAVLEGAIAALRESTKTTRNLQRTLHTKRVFDLVSSTDLIHAKQAVKNQVNPRIGLLVGQMEARVGKLQKREASLINKVNLNEVRLSKGVNLGGESQKKVLLRQLRVRKMRLKQSLGHAINP